MKEKTKKILKGVGVTLGAVALLTIGVGIGACSGKNGSTQPITTTPIRKGLNQKPNKAPSVDNDTYNYLSDAVLIENVDSNLEGCVHSDIYFTMVVDLPTGYYFCDSPISWSFYVRVVGFDCTFNQLKDFVTLGKLSDTRADYPDGFNATTAGVGDLNEGFYFYWKGGPALICETEWVVTEIYMVDVMDVPSQDILELPNNWSPLRMVAKNVNKENNLIFDTDWNNWTDVPIANGLPMLDLSTMLFKNQGRVYNHIYIYFKNLNGLKYATNSENIGTGTATDWCADRVEYAFIVGNSLKYNYLAASVGTSILKGESVYNLGLNWSSSSARKLEILDKHYPNVSSIGDTALKRFPRTPTTSLDPITNEIIRPFGYFVWDYDYLLEYSNVTSVDFLLGGNSDVFGIFTNAFNSVIPLLSVQVLPSLSLGILLFLPLIGGIIVVIIRVIKK